MRSRSVLRATRVPLPVTSFDGWQSMRLTPALVVNVGCHAFEMAAVGQPSRCIGAAPLCGLRRPAAIVPAFPVLIAP